MRELLDGPARGGFTLVELIVAVVVLTLGILGSAATAKVVASLIQASHLQTLVRARSQAQMESVLALGPDLVDSGEREIEGGRISWLLSGDDPRGILVVVRQRLGRRELTDSLATLVARS